ncbi:hypothetical protein BDV38DRAFT_168076 [Aspergillus pseudotamarii]|uniref:Uncharacterized protein n=1 Tax=Aspergillus pseudotamarii TaxID=132259 RepID=A0A5N6SK73_ASPPS|nr:uncharacterized protein BDV38DRAFT_168076 [Aspergillus pseudotamarii]KAE8134160.1 hypothetical protein BDV38DRAFT_168076 [Aspergillus pseudotamarii]
MAAFLSILRDRFLHWSTFQVARCVTSIFLSLLYLFLLWVCVWLVTLTAEISENVMRSNCERQPEGRGMEKRPGSTGPKGGTQPLYKDREKNFSLHRNHFTWCVSSGSDHHGQPCDLSDIPLETIEFNPYIPDLAAIL